MSLPKFLCLRIGKNGHDSKAEDEAAPVDKPDGRKHSSTDDLSSPNTTAYNINSFRMSIGENFQVHGRIIITHAFTHITFYLQFVNITKRINNAAILL